MVTETGPHTVFGDRYTVTGIWSSRSQQGSGSSNWPVAAGLVSGFLKFDHIHQLKPQYLLIMLIVHVCTGR